MGDIARGSHRFVAGCARCLRTALAGIRTTDDDGLAETRRARQAHPRSGSSYTLSGALLAGSMAVASGSHRLRAALAGIPLTDEDSPLGGDRAGQANLRRRLALASPAVAAGLLAGAVTPTPVQAQEAPTSAASAPGLKTSTASAPAQNPSPPPPPPPEPPMMIELVGGLGVLTPVGPWGGELGILVNPENGHIQFTGMGGLYAGGKVGVEHRQARAPGVVLEGKVQQALGPLYRGELVAQGNFDGVGGSWKVQGGPAFVGQSVEVLPNPSVEWRGGGQARLPGPDPLFGAVAAAGVRGTTPEIPVDVIQVAEDWQTAAAGPIDPARFEGQPPPEDPWVTFIEWMGDQFGSQGSAQPPATSPPPDWSEAGELGGAYGEQIGAPIGPGGGDLLGQFMERVAVSGAQGATSQPVDPTQLGEQFAEAWNEFAEAADPSGGLGATVPAPTDLARIGEALNQLWGQTVAPPAPAAVPAPLPVLPPAFDQLIAQDPALAQLLAQLVAQDPALAQLIVRDPALARLLAQNPGLARALAQDPTLAPALSRALAPAPPGEPGMDWEQTLQDMNGPVLVDPEWFQDQPASDMEDTEDTDGVDAPAFDMDDAQAEPDDGEDDSEPDDDGGEEPTDDSGDEEPESDDDEPSDDSGDEVPESNDDDGEDDSEPDDDDDGGEEASDDSADEELESDDDEPSDDSGDEEPESNDDDGEEESESDDSGGEEESDDGGGGGEEESEPESDDDGGEEESGSDEGGGEPAPESDEGGGEPAPEGGGGDGGSDGGGGEAEAPAPAAPEPGPAPEEPAEPAPEPDYEADSSWTGMVEGSGPCDVC